MKRSVGQIFGAILFVVGLIWMGQGSGAFPYPASSFMIDQTPWIYWGALAAMLGLGLFLLARRPPR